MDYDIQAISYDMNGILVYNCSKKLRLNDSNKAVDNISSLYFEEPRGHIEASQDTLDTKKS